jgi:hypothetical protein
MDELDFVKELIARLPTRRDQALVPLKIMFGSAADRFAVSEPRCGLRPLMVR